MGSPTYSAPPLNPEINQSSPFYSSLAGLVMWTQAAVPPRGIIHNAMGHATAGYSSQTNGYFTGGYATGSEGVIIPNSFPFNPPADGAFTYDYSLATSGMQRTREWLYEGYQPQGGISGCTIFGIFQFNGGHFHSSGAYYPLFGLNTSTYAKLGQVSSMPDAICLSIANNSVYLGFLAALGPCYSTQFPVIPGHWYACAVTRSDQVGTGINGTFSLQYMMRMYLYDLTTGTRIGPNGVGASQTFTNGSTVTTDHITSGYSLSQYHNSPIGGELAVPLACDALAGSGALASTMLIKMMGVDSQPWDDSGFGYAIPAAFSGTDQFSYWINNIYEMVGSSYATGTTAGGLLANADYDISGSQYLYAGWANATTSPGAINGANSNTQFVFLGDAALTDVNNKTVQITASRPQASPTTTPSSQLTYSLYRYPQGPVMIISAITKANPGVVTCLQPYSQATNMFTNGQQVSIYNVGGMTQLNGNTYTVAGVTYDSFQLSGTDTTGFTTYTSGGFVLPSGSTAVATNTTGNFIYTPPDTNYYNYLITATDGTNFYFWNPVPASLNLYPDQNFMTFGNSIYADAGRLPGYWLHLISGFRTRTNLLDFSQGSAGPLVALPNISGTILANFGGTATNLDTISLIFNNSNLPGGTQTATITISTSETPTAMATAMAAAITANSAFATAGITATSSVAQVNINAGGSTVPTSFNYTITGAATETVVLVPDFGVPAWDLASANWYQHFTKQVTFDVANRGFPYTAIGQMSGNALTLDGPTYASQLTTIQNALLALTTTYVGPTVGSLTHGQTVSVFNKIIWATGVWQRGGHTYNNMSAIPYFEGLEQSVSNGTTVFSLGSDAFYYSSNYPEEARAGHPGPNTSRMEMMALIKDLFLTTTGGGGGGGAFS